MRSLRNIFGIAAFIGTFFFPVVGGFYTPPVAQRSQPLCNYRESHWLPGRNDQDPYLHLLEKKAQRRRNEPRRRRGVEKDKKPRPAALGGKPQPNRLLVPVRDPVFEWIIRGLKNASFPSEPKLGKSSTKTSETGAFRLEDVQGRYNFSNVGGYRELKAELHQILDLIRSREEAARYGLRIPRGILLEGPPGNGKTLIAKCLAGEADMNFISCAGAEFNEKYVGVGAARIRELFRFAEENKPCIVFIDEIDAVGRRRSGDGEAANAERDTTLNQLLVMMDGFSSATEIVVVCATNRADILDAALLRPGRVDKIIHVSNPDAETRREILKIHISNKPVNASLDHLTRTTQGMSGAQIENLLNEAVLFSLRNKSLPVEARVLDMVKEKTLVGQTSGLNRNLSETTMRRVAVHEIGHLMMALASTHYERPWKVTIDSMNPKNSLGYTIFETDENEQGIFVREYFEDKIKVLLGGRVAEEVFYGNSISSGALSDLESAFSMAKKMVMEYGMGSEIVYPYFSETYKKRIDEQIHSIIARAHRETKHYLDKNKRVLQQFAETLLEKRTLHTDEIYELHRLIEPRSES